MKKILVLMLAVLMLGSFAACKNGGQTVTGPTQAPVVTEAPAKPTAIPMPTADPNATPIPEGDFVPEDVEPYARTNDWRDGMIKVDGVWYQLYSPLSRFNANGWDFDPKVYNIHDDYVLAAGQKMKSVEPIKLLSEKYGDKCSIVVELVNKDTVDHNIKNTYIWTISVGDSGEQDIYAFEIPGLTLGMTEEQVKAAIGEPYKTDARNAGVYLTYRDADYGIDMQLYVDNETGLKAVAMSVYERPSD